MTGGGGGGGPHPGAGGHPGGGGGGGFQSFQFGAGGPGGGGGGGGGGFNFGDPFKIFEQFFGGGGMGGGGGGGGGRRAGGGGMGRGGSGGGMGGGGGGASDLYSDAEGRDVLKLTAATFKRTVGKEARGNKVFLLEFYSPSCGHCVRLAPTIGKLATALKGAVGVATVNCASEPKICESYGVRGYPTLYLLGPGGRPAEEYTGPRTGAALKEALAALVPSRVAVVAGNGAAGRGALDKLLAQRCGWFAGGGGASATAGGKAGGSSSKKHQQAGAAGAPRQTAGCVLVFSDKAEPSLLVNALSTAPEFDTKTTTPTGSAAAGVPGFVFVHVPTAVDKATGAPTKDTVAAALGIKRLPHVALAHGTSLQGVIDAAALTNNDVASAPPRGTAAASSSGSGAGGDAALAASVAWPEGLLHFASAGGGGGSGGAADYGALRSWLAQHQQAIIARLGVARKHAAAGAGASASASGSGKAQTAGGRK